MATIEKRGRYQWRAKVRRKNQPVRSRTFETKLEAEVWARQLETEFDRGAGISTHIPSQMTLAQALDRYEAEVTPHKKGSKPEKYRLALWRREGIADYLMFEVKGSDLARWRDRSLAEGYSASKIRNDLNLLSHVYTIADLLPRNVPDYKLEVL